MLFLKPPKNAKHCGMFGGCQQLLCVGNVESYLIPPQRWQTDGLMHSWNVCAWDSIIFVQLTAYSYIQDKIM